MGRIENRALSTGSTLLSLLLVHFLGVFHFSGMHAESSVFTTIYGLLFWDIIYMAGIPDTFYNVYQYQPLDFQTDLFYERRQEKLDEQLENIRKSTKEVDI